MNTVFIFGSEDYGNGKIFQTAEGYQRIFIFA